MKTLGLLLVFVPLVSFANVKFSFQNEELSKMIETYSKASGQKIVVDPGVRGRGTISGADDVTNEEAFNLLSNVLAVNGYAVSKRDDVWLVANARNMERSLIETTTTLPPLKPERLVTYVVTLKHVSAEEVSKQVRNLISKDGELSVFAPRNQILITDYASSLQHADAILREVDQPAAQPTELPKKAEAIAPAKKTTKR